MTPSTPDFAEPLEVVGMRRPAGSTSPPLLEVENLSVEFATQDGVVNAVNGISYHLEEGETLAILGESGSGKSVSAQAVMGLIEKPGRVTRGRISYRGADLLQLPERERRRVRGAKIAMIFQDALSALNPVFPVGFQIGEMFRIHRGSSRGEARRRAVELMERVGIPSAKGRVGDYPHQFSGGMRQRVMIAMAIALDPEVLIADEPTTALDVTVQAQILVLLEQLREETGMGLILITHDLGVVAEVADRVAVMYAGRIVEHGPVGLVFANPRHPYTEGLMHSIPRADRHGERLEPIVGSPPSLSHIPAGCAFHPRCRYARPQCRAKVPSLVALPSEQATACLFWEEVGRG